ncbi:MAG: glycerol-3-phosphate 1-O-acyltransferase PlsY [Candidatus Stahlbacteria bacterium]|nr:glycerol-3-phosphate 1-O-acyltransferase PlsY [Candidatus Stahlbacteria bacterium]
MNFILSCLLGFTIGSIPFGYLLAKWIKKIDIRQHGSGNIGATNVWRVCGRKLGIIVFILDASKGLLPVLWLSYYNINYALLCGIGAILGHTFTPYLKFKGGKSVATGLGIFIGIAPIQAIISFGFWILILQITGWVSVASMGASATLVILIFLAHHLSPIFFFTLTSFLLVVVAHRSNIKRLIQGKEPKLKTSKHHFFS